MANRASSLVLAAFVVSLVATLGSLFFSDVMNFTPCTLCWYQRIFMYPLCLILGLGLYRGDKHALNYSYPLSSIGLLVSIYHLLVYFGIVPEKIVPCSEMSSCTTTYIQWLGFITIPMVSFCAFLIIFLIHHALKKSNKGSQKHESQ